ncbi:DNA ligase D [Edaphobacillus lindanitolerans]|uniref:Bifunctional non-homologous end joining protein LigD n=1 Tax=Edaphobacillus lindanitolerans TaxID=550447 RepID=A0A1U7PL86_9BACI|nr:DNA ligase D [Edaphobacillus lindanitolerans]SIT87367.1 bifunctional non-homologous end joining protein LigD [Edaphobacillus lindanitolerans]
MKLTPAEELPDGPGWLYEIKYDGFRCLLDWRENGIRLMSRNGHDLAGAFPEITEACLETTGSVAQCLPLLLDGELVHLLNDARSDFATVSRRSRMRAENTIAGAADRFPCRFAAFDVLELSGRDLRAEPLEQRKQALRTVLEAGGFPSAVSAGNPSVIQGIASSEDPDTVQTQLLSGNGEGIVAKRSGSRWTDGIRTTDWMKVKNWRRVPVILTEYEQENGYFTGCYLDHEELIPAVSFKNGLSDEEARTLSLLFQQKGEQKSAGIWTLAPAICAELLTIGEAGGKLREPRFSRFLHGEDPETVTARRLARALEPIPPGVAVTNPDKPLFPEAALDKDGYLLYLQEAAPYLLPWLRDRPLTVIRWPHGTEDERFYQKHAPDPVPPFVETSPDEDGPRILCNNLETLLWLGNQAALEFHVPFGRLDSPFPDEIVFDLDPPDASRFDLAADAALRLKQVFDSFGLLSFAKTSGGKGLQLYIPLPEGLFTYADTRRFTEIAARFLCEQSPERFTTERLIKNRHGRLYVDYVQHAEGKTIICPYSTRGTAHAPVATPIEWHELKEGIRPRELTVPVLLNRMKEMGDPFRTMDQARDRQPFGEVLEKLREIT